MKSSELEERRREQEKMLAEEQERLEKLEQQRQMRDREYEASCSLFFFSSFPQKASQVVHA